MNKMEHMKELIVKLNKAAEIYYQGQDEIMSNIEYDKLYDELVVLEKETGVTMTESPTVHVGYETLSDLPKEAHIAPMLSLDKTKNVSELIQFVGDEKGLLSLKLDGLSVILTYQNGVLVKALTRGNGEVGEVITNNAKTFVNIPARISFTGELVIRGEALIKYSDFHKMNEETEEVSQKYKNPRNLCSGTVRQLNNEITARRRVHYFLYNIINTDYEMDFVKKSDQWTWLESLGFQIAPNKHVDATTIADAVREFEQEITNNDIPSDGLVLTFDDIKYSQKLGRTAKFPKDSIAFKWKDETAETTLKEIEWSASRTGLINPVAVFEPVELEGTTVSRASIHNVSIVRELELGVGDTISVYKANMIIPQIAENKTKSNQLEIPKQCPVCGAETRIVNENGSEVLMCPNKKCEAKRIKSFTHFVSRNAMNIDGLSEATLEKLIARGYLHHLDDIFTLQQYKDKLITMDGFGEKSYENLIKSIEASKDVELPNLIYSLGIKGVGLSVAKLICNHFQRKLEELQELSVEQLTEIDGIGEVLASSFVEFFQKSETKILVQRFSSILHITLQEVKTEGSRIAGKTFVITGSLNAFTNRSECKERIEQLGGKVAGSVSKNTDFLVNNDTTSRSSKNNKAKELGVVIISEEELLDLLQKQ